MPALLNKVAVLVPLGALLTLCLFCDKYLSVKHLYSALWGGADQPRPIAAVNSWACRVGEYQQASDAFFGSKLLSMRSFGLSVLLTVTVVGLLWTPFLVTFLRTYDSEHPLVWLKALSTLLLGGILLSAVLTALPDYVSLIQTRLFIRLAQRLGGFPPSRLVLLVVDFRSSHEFMQPAGFAAFVLPIPAL